MITDTKMNVYSKGFYYTGKAVVDGKKANFYYEDGNITITGKLSDDECYALRKEIEEKLSATAGE